MIRLTLTCTVLLAMFTACETTPVSQNNQAPQALARNQTTPAPEAPVKIQAIPAPEISGAVNIGGDRVMLVADEGYDVQIVSNAEATFKSGDPKEFASNMKPAIAGVTVNTKASKEIIDDLEDAAWDDKEQSAFVISSHSLNKNNLGFKEKPGRYKLARLLFKDGKVVASKEVDVLRVALMQAFPFVSNAMNPTTAPHETGGDTGTFNIEGLAFDPITASLLIGLRSPTQMRDGKSSAVVFRLKNPHELFKDKPAPPEFDTQFISLDLGKLGIRGMTYDGERKGYWIVAGRSDDPEDPAETTPTPTPTTAPASVPSSLWFWDAAKPNEAPRKAQIDGSGFVSHESICLLKKDGQQGLLLIRDDSKKKPSRYLWIPIPKLETP